MKRRISSLLVVLWAVVLCAHGQITLHGRVLSEDSIPLRDAAVLLFAANDSLPQQVTDTDKRGEYMLKVDAQCYTIEVVMMGYEPKERELDLTDVSGTYRVPDIVIKNAVRQLGEVNIRGEQLQTTVVLEDDKEVYTLSSRVKRNANSVFMAMTDVPGLDVDLVNNSMSVQGESGRTLIMVNGIRRNKGYLQVIDPKNIDKVEVIRIPSMRYVSQGIGSIINIITKEPVLGLAGNIQFREDILVKAGHQDGAFTLVGDKWTWTVNASNFHANMEQDRYLERRTRRGDSWETVEKNAYGDPCSKGFNPVVGMSIDYSPSKNSFSSLSANYYYSKWDTDIPYYIKVTMQEEDRSYLGAQVDDDFSQGGTVSFYHHTKWKDIHTFSVDARYKLTKSDNENCYTEMEQVGTLPFYRTDQQRDKKSSDAYVQANMEHKWKKVSLGEGYRFSWKQTDLSNRLNERTTDLLYDEWRNNVYVDLSGKFHPKWFYRVGANLDIAKTSILGHTHVYADVIPKVTLRYNMTPKQYLSATYQRSRQMPTITMLNPTPETVDSVRVYQGDPNLLPVHGNKVGLSFYSYKNKVYLFLSLSYSWGEAFSSVSKITDKGVNLITYGRASERKLPYASLDLAWQITKWLKLGVYSTAGYSMYKDANESQFNRNLWQTSVMPYGTVNFKRVYGTIKFPLPIKQRTLTGYALNTRECYALFSYRITNSWSATLGLHNILPIKGQSETNIDGYYEFYRNHNQGFKVLVGAAYTFRKGRKAKSQQRVSKNLESSEEGSGNNVERY